MVQDAGADQVGKMSAILVGDYITALGGGRFTPMQVLKLAYISHGYMLAITGRPLFDDRIEAWDYGPVIPNLYHAIKIHGKAPIPHLYTCKTPVGGAEMVKRQREIGEILGPNKRAIIEKTVETYGGYAGFQLSYITHMEGSPWKDVFRPGVRHIEIKDKDIGPYYKEQLAR